MILSGLILENFESTGLIWELELAVGAWKYLACSARFALAFLA